MKKIESFLIITLVFSLLVLAPKVFAAQEINGQKGVRALNIDSVMEHDGSNRGEIEARIQGDLEEFPIVEEVSTIVDDGRKRMEEVRNNIELYDVSEENMPVMATTTGMENGRKGEASNDALRGSEERMNMVSEAAGEIVRAGSMNQDLGEQVREIVQEQNRNQEKIESKISEIKKRSKIKTFFFGADYEAIDIAQDSIKNYEERIEAIKEIVETVSDETNSEVLNEQIAVIEGVKDELAAEIEKEEKGFSLFGWVNRLFSGRNR